MEQLPAVPDLDRMIFSSDDVYSYPPERVVERQVEWIRDAVGYHIERCGAYRDFADRGGFTIERLQSADDLDSVPQYPTSVFKKRPPRSVNGAQTVEFRSSGTTGAVSVVSRDDTTLHRLAGSMRSALTLLQPIIPRGPEMAEQCVVLNLGPSKKESEGIWFSYIMSLVEVMAPTRHLFSEGNVGFAAVGDDLRELLSDGRKVGIFGPPFLLRDAALAMLPDRAVKGGPDVLILSGGGWKRSSSDAMDRVSFTNLMVEAFGLEDLSQVRDAFNQVELNSVFVECSAHRKHIPPWVRVIPRDVRTMRALPPGEEGVLTYLDPSATSFPCFLIGDDMGSINASPCTCGRPSTTVTVQRKLARSSKEGCGNKIERLATERNAARRGDSGL